MWTTDVYYNLTDCSQAWFIFCPGDQSVTVELSLLGSKYGQTPVAPKVVGSYPASANTPIGVSIDLTDPYFNGGYGAVRGRSTNSNHFVAYSHKRTPDSYHPISGTAFAGAAFRLPLTGESRGQTAKLVITNIAGSSATVTIRDPRPGGFSDSFVLGAGATLRWDSSNPFRNLTLATCIEVISLATCVVSACVIRSNYRFHTHLAVLA